MRIHFPLKSSSPYPSSQEDCKEAVRRELEPFSVDQVREIRRLATAGQSEEDICIAVGARSCQQVRGLMEGRNYNRVP